MKEKNFKLISLFNLLLLIILVGLFMINATLRTLSNYNSETRDVSNVYRLFSEDWNEVVAKISSGTDSVNTSSLSIAGSTVIDGSKVINGSEISSDGNIYGDETSQCYLVKKATISYTDTTAKNLLSLVGSATVYDIKVYVLNAFNDSTTDQLDIGITSSGTYYDTLIDVSSTGWATTTLSNIPDFESSSTYVTSTYNGGTGDATAGTAYLYIFYTRND